MKPVFHTSQIDAESSLPSRHLGSNGSSRPSAGESSSSATDAYSEWERFEVVLWDEV